MFRAKNKLIDLRAKNKLIDLCAKNELIDLRAKNKLIDRRHSFIYLFICITSMYINSYVYCCYR